MPKLLRLPAALAFAVLGGAAGLVTTASCGHAPSHGDAGPRDGAVTDRFAVDSVCAITCVQQGPNQNACGCVDRNGMCPSGCYPCELFCIPDGTDAGAASCPTCADQNDNCPSGCRPVA